jgi:hypothetical protein
MKVEASVQFREQSKEVVAITSFKAIDDLDPEEFAKHSKDFRTIILEESKQLFMDAHEYANSMTFSKQGVQQ